jgi:hypothetical protein
MNSEENRFASPQPFIAFENSLAEEPIPATPAVSSAHPWDPGFAR